MVAGFVERPCRYFENPGSKNTEAVLEAVSRRVGEGDLRVVVVSSTSGKTGLMFVEALREKASVIVVSYEKLRPEFRERILELGGSIIEESDLPLHKRGMDKVRNTLYMLGQGFKVAVEVILIAVDKDLVKPRQIVIGVGGTSRGVDTAIVAKASSSKDMLGPDVGRRLEVREVLAMPLRKKWWE